MASLKALKARIKGIKGTQKITKAMQLIAAARLKGIRHKVESTKLYMSTMDSVLTKLGIEDLRSVMQSSTQLEGTKSIKDKNRSDLLESEDELIKQSPTTLVILFTADRGLCGQFNASLIKTARNEIASIGRDHVEVLCIGRKGYEAMKRDNITLAQDLCFAYPHVKQINFAYMRESVSNIVKIIQSYQTHRVIYSKFITMIKQEVIVEKTLGNNNGLNDIPTLPEAYTTSQSHNARTWLKSGNNISYDGEYQTILQQAVAQYLTAKIFSLMLGSMLSEHTARMLAMDGATRNSSKMLEILSRQYNQNRQSQITRELIEIISGMEAIETS